MACREFRNCGELESADVLCVLRLIERAWVIALCLLAGWLGIYQHKQFNLTSAKTATSERILAQRAAEMPDDLQEIRSISEALEPRLAYETDKLQIALLLRDMLHHRIKIYEKVRYDGYDFTDLAGTYSRSLLNPKYGHLCGGISVQYMAALRAFGIPSRKVGLYPAVSNLQTPAISHASVDVLVSGKWVAMDPTFNVAFKREDGSYLGWFDIAQELRNGADVIESTDEYMPKARTLTEDLRLGKSNLFELTAYINASPYWDGHTRNDAVVIPASWDGVLHYEDGTVFRAKDVDSQGVYALLARPGGIVSRPPGVPNPPPAPS